MEIVNEVKEITSYEPLDKEPYHYIAAVKSKGCSGWMFTYVWPTTDKQVLINHLISSSSYDEARIMKVRLPIG